MDDNRIFPTVIAFAIACATVTCAYFYMNRSSDEPTQGDEKPEASECTLLKTHLFKCKKREGHILL